MEGYFGDSVVWGVGLRNIRGLTVMVAGSTGEWDFKFHCCDGVHIQEEEL